MKLVYKNETDTSFVTLITDLNGKIIFMNKPAISKLKTIKVGDDISKIIDIDYVRKVTMLENWMDIVVPKISQFNRAVIKVSGKSVSKLLEVYLINDESLTEDDLLNDKRLFATYHEIIGTNITRKIKLNDFLELIAACIKEDMRFSYRKIHVNKTEENPELYINFAHLSTIVTGVIIAINEIDYRNPIELSLENLFGEYVLHISVEANTFYEAQSIAELSELYPKIAMRLVYITSLCKSDDIEYKIFLKNKKVTASFIVSDMINETGRFSFYPFTTEDKSIVAYVFSLFAYASNNQPSEQDLIKE